MLRTTPLSLTQSASTPLQVPSAPALVPENAPALVDEFDDPNRACALRHVLSLRQKAQSGQDIKRSDLLTHTQQVSGTSADLFLDRSYYTEGLLPAIRDAQDSIHIAISEFYGVFGDYLGNLLIQKKRENPNLAIRIIADSQMSHALFPWSEGTKRLGRLKDNGIEVELNPYFTSGKQMEHRKLFIIDGTTAFFGGAPVADQYFGSDPFWDHYQEIGGKLGAAAAQAIVFSPDDATRALHAFPADIPTSHDFSIRYQGDGVHHLQASFLQSWLFQGGTIDNACSDKAIVERYFPVAKTPAQVARAAKFTHVVPEGPSEMIHNLLDIIDGAQQTLDMELAYIFEPEIMDALCRAAERGVDVRVITNGYESVDWKPTYWVYRGHYERLLKAGVHLFELKQYSHVKLIVADKQVVFASTGNAEWGSVSTYWDENVFIDSAALADDVQKRVIERDIEDDRAKEVTPENLKPLNTLQKFLVWILSWLIPLVMRGAIKETPRRHDVIFEAPRTLPTIAGTSKPFLQPPVAALPSLPGPAQDL